MSTNEPNDRFLSEEELRALLDRWQSPEPSEVLDKRITSSYLREIKNVSALNNSIQLPKTDNEVVAMKFCSTCQEEFADKFSFCPVDGTPLTVATAAVVAPIVEPSVTASPSITAMQDNGDAVIRSSEPPPVYAEAATYTEPIAAPVSANALVKRGEYHLTIMSDTGLASRLGGELKDVAHNYELTWPEFKRDPIGFVKRSVVGYGQMAKGFLGNRNVLIAMSVAVLALVALGAVGALLDRHQSNGSSRAGVIIFALAAFCVLVAMFASWMGKERGAAVMGAQPSDSRTVAYGMVAAFAFIFAVLGVLIFQDHRHRNELLAEKTRDDLQLEQVIDIPQEQPTPDVGTAGMAKGNGGGSKPKQEKAGGGGGGGREEAKPASAGKLPQVDLRVPQVVAPDPHPPVVKNPVLPVAATLDADPKLFPPDTRNLNYGDPKSKSTEISSGSGTGNGIGNGTGGGVGPGSGGGYGPGNGGNTGGGDRHEGGGGAGGGGGGTDYNKIFNSKDVTSKARVTFKPEPQYTEEARKNQVVGTVMLQAVFTANGQVTQIRALKELPNGLTEKAIAAARQIRFEPAMKDGHPVSMYMHLEYNFNLY
jgi:TonB family protein